VGPNSHFWASRGITVIGGQAEERCIKAIIFDCDGTLVDSDDAHYLAWRHALGNQGYELTTEYYKSNFAGVAELTVSKMAYDLVGFDCSVEVLHDKNEYFYQLQLEGIAPIEATIEFLHHLAQEKERYGLKLAVASGGRKEDVLRSLKNLEIDHLFDVVLSGHDDLQEYDDPQGTNKPKPYIYLKAAKLLGVAPEECIAIEDSRTGVSAAVAAGCITIAVPNQYTLGQDLSDAHFKVESFSGLDVDDFFEEICNEKYTQPRPKV